MCQRLGQRVCDTPTCLKTTREGPPPQLRSSTQQSVPCGLCSHQFHDGWWHPGEGRDRRGWAKPQIPASKRKTTRYQASTLSMDRRHSRADASGASWWATNDQTESEHDGVLCILHASGEFDRCGPTGNQTCMLHGPVRNDAKRPQSLEVVGCQNKAMRPCGVGARPPRLGNVGTTHVSAPRRVNMDRRDRCGDSNSSNRSPSSKSNILSKVPTDPPVSLTCATPTNPDKNGRAANHRSMNR